jgi:hypothetical protein
VKQPVVLLAVDPLLIFNVLHNTVKRKPILKKVAIFIGLSGWHTVCKDLLLPLLILGHDSLDKFRVYWVAFSESVAQNLFKLKF